MHLFNKFFRRARTLYPCEADNPSELSFEANVIISNGKCVSSEKISDCKSKNLINFFFLK